MLEVRYRLFEEREGTLDHPGVALFEPPELQYQAVARMVLVDERALQPFVASPGKEKSSACFIGRPSSLHLVLPRPFVAVEAQKPDAINVSCSPPMKTCAASKTYTECRRLLPAAVATVPVESVHVEPPSVVV